MKHTYRILAALSLAPLHAAEIHVSPNGNDANLGTAERPLATVAAAQRAARKVAGRGPVTVWLHGGVYYLPETIQFTPANSGSTCAAAPGEKAGHQRGREWRRVRRRSEGRPQSAVQLQGHRWIWAQALDISASLRRRLEWRRLCRWKCNLTRGKRQESNFRHVQIGGGAWI
ncbi:MAG: hypothetical protein FJ388_13825 [Verrucomicrobia bacterium]|nr:hypothetical protein [Verrucomicrobiota bacterium]